MVLGLLAATATLLPAASAGATPGHHLVFNVGGPSRQNLVATEAVVVNAKCPTETCKVVAYGSSKSLGVRTAKVHARIKKGTHVKMALPLSPGQVANLRTALESDRYRKGPLPILTIHATAKDSFGNKIPVSLNIKIAKP